MMKTIKDVKANMHKPGFMTIYDSDGNVYEFNIHDLVNNCPKWETELKRYDDVNVMDRSLYIVNHPSHYLGIVRWQNDNCDIPYLMFEPNYEDLILPYCILIGRE